MTGPHSHLINEINVYGCIDTILKRDQFEENISQLNLPVSYHEEDEYNQIEKFWSYITYSYDSSTLKLEGNTSKNKPNAKICIVLVRNKDLENFVIEKSCLNHLKWLRNREDLSNCWDTIQVMVVGPKAKKNVYNEENEMFMRIMNPKSSNVSKKSQKLPTPSFFDEDQLEQKLIELQLELDINFTFCTDTFAYNKWINCMMKSAIRVDSLTANEKQIQNNIFTLDKMFSNKIPPNSTNWKSKCWIQQLTQFRSIDEDVAKSISRHFPSMFELRKAIIENRPNLLFLENLVVEKGYGVLATKTTVGAAVARQLAQVVTSSNPNEYVL